MTTIHAKQIRLEIDGARYVAIPEEEFNKHFQAPQFIPWPKAGADGNFPAVEVGRVSLANQIIAWRHAAELSQAELAQRAGVRAETISRLEGAKHMPGAKTVDKLAKVLEKAIPWAKVPKPPGI